VVNIGPTAITVRELDGLKRQGMNQAEIAEALGVTRQAVSYIKRGSAKTPRNEHFLQTPREVAMESYPWKRVPREHSQSELDKRLRDHAEYMATGGKGMSERKLYRLVLFYRRLQTKHLVVEYHPDIPPSAENKYGGYAYRPREPRDGELIIRVNDRAEMSDTAWVIWRFPPKLPEV
jgi:transcriptional regulator with XRE-family HTH domain